MMKPDSTFTSTTCQAASWGDETVMVLGDGYGPTDLHYSLGRSHRRRHDVDRDEIARFAGSLPEHCGDWLRGMFSICGCGENLDCGVCPDCDLPSSEGVML